MKNGILTHSVPVLFMGKKIIKAPKGMTKEVAQAKLMWYIEFWATNPETGTEERFRRTHNLNRIKDPAAKLERGNLLVVKYAELLKAGYNPFTDNEELKTRIVALTFQEAQQEFILYHIGKGSRSRTLTSFRSKTKMLMEYVGENKKITEVTSIDITRFMNETEAQKKWEAKTFEVTRQALSTFFNYLKNMGRITQNPLDGFKERRKILKSERHQLYSDVDFEAVGQWLQANDPYTLFCLQAIYFTCIRPAELRLLQLKHIDIDRQLITIPGNISKNKKTETIHVDTEFIAILRELDFSKFTEEDYLTGNTKTIIGIKPAPEKTAYNGLRACLKALNLLGKGYTLYSSKHLSNVRKRRAKWSIEEIQVANRHSSIAQTEIYLRDLMKDVKVNKPIPSMFALRSTPSISGTD